MLINSPVLERARPASDSELARIPWLLVLPEADRAQAACAMRVAPARLAQRTHRIRRVTPSAPC